MDDTTADVLARAFRSCAGKGCPKCHVEAGQHCRNHLAERGWVNARFHKPRQVAAGVLGILEPVGIRHLKWQPAIGGAWTGQRITA